MATVTSTHANSTLPPPTERYTVLGWLRKNLFSGWLNTLLTLVVAVLLYTVLRPVLTWMLNAAEWEVIPANWNLIMRGQYPADQVYRLWFVLYLLGGVVGLAWGVWGRNLVWATLVVFAIPLLLMLIPWFGADTRLNLMMVELIGLACYAIGRFGPSWLGRVATWAIVLFFPAAILLVRGFGMALPVVQSNVWGGLLLSLMLAAVGIVFSFPLGVLLALGRQSKLPAIRILSVVYIEFIRGVPLISLLFMAQVMLQLFLPDGFPPVDRILRAMVAITLFSAAYTAENVRGGLQSIPKGQTEAAHALGLNGFQTMLRIVLPQALTAVIPVLVGQFIGLFKDTSLVALVGLFDLLGIARSILANPDWLGTQMEVYLVIAAIYWVFSYSMSYASRRLEMTLGRGRR